MAAVGTIRLVWSGGEHDFCAAKIGTLLAIEERCKSGVAAIYNRILDGSWSVNDVTEVIRLSLIGAGMSADEAQKMVNVHVLCNPNGLAPSVLIAMRVIEAVLVGVPDDPLGKTEAVEEEKTATEFSQTMDASAAQQSMELEPSSSGTRE